MSAAPVSESQLRRRSGVVTGTRLTLAHGGGGKAMRDLIDDVFVRQFANPDLDPLRDQATFALSELATLGDRLAFTTDSFVVDPLEFPGGDIGKLAVCGTINDLAVGGAKPLYLSCSVIAEEGLDLELLRRVTQSMAESAAQAGVRIVTGDTKVVNKGACDKLFLNTAGIGVIDTRSSLSTASCRPGDKLLVNGVLGDHGATILEARGDMALQTSITSDCAALHEVIATLLDAVPQTRFLRDATRGGLATVTNEIAEGARAGVELWEDATPIREEVKGFCEILGLDPLYLANEGKFVAVVPEADHEVALAALHSHPLGNEAAVIGEITDDQPGRVVLRTGFGGRRIVDMLVGEQLPRIC